MPEKCGQGASDYSGSPCIAPARVVLRSAFQWGSDASLLSSGLRKPRLQWVRAVSLWPGGSQDLESPSMSMPLATKSLRCMAGVAIVLGLASFVLMSIPMGFPTVSAAMTGQASVSGYWLVASDGGIFAYGDAPFEGSPGGTPLNKPIVGMAPVLLGRSGAQIARRAPASSAMSPPPGYTNNQMIFDDAFA